METTREEHLAWCKKRAFAYLEQGDLQNAVASMGSDLQQHPETANYRPELLAIAMMYIMRHDAEAVRRWIKGFH